MTESTNKPRRPLWRRILKWTFRAAVLLVLLALLAHSVWNYIATRRLNAELERIRQAGEPTTFGELAKSLKKAPPTEDGGPYYSAALELVRRDLRQRQDKVDEELGPDPNHDSRPDARLLGELRALTEEDHPALEMLDRGAAMPGCNFDLGLRFGLGPAMARLSPTRALVRACSRRTRLLAFQGDGNAAAHSAVCSLRMLRMLDNQPMLIAHLVKVACQPLTVSDIEIVLRYGRPSPEALAELDQALRQTEESIDLRRVFLTERVYALEICRSAVFARGAFDPDEDYQGPEILPRGWWAAPAIKTMTVGLLRLDARFIELAGKGWPAFADGLPSIGRGSYVSWPFNGFAGIAAEGFERSVTACGRSLGTLRSARVAVLVERYRRQKQQRPTSLEELAKHFSQELPLDPFTGKGLIYRQEPGGYVVYSVGDDRKDDQAARLGQTDWGIRIRE